VLGGCCLDYPKRVDGVMDRYEEKKGLGILFDHRSARFMSLNPVAWEIWKLCDGSHSTGDIADAITQIFEVSGDQASEDVLEVLGDMESRGLIQGNDSSKPGVDARGD